MERSLRNTKLHGAIFLGKLTVAQLFMEPSIFYGTQRSIMVFAKTQTDVSLRANTIYQKWAY